MLDLSYWDKRAAKAEREYREYQRRLLDEFHARQAERYAAERRQNWEWLRRSWARHAREELANRPERQYWLMTRDDGIHVYQRDQAEPVIVEPEPGRATVNTDECARRLLARREAAERQQGAAVEVAPLACSRLAEAKALKHH
jgi:hypothetical protein